MDQDSEQLIRDNTDNQLLTSGWLSCKESSKIAADKIREYKTSVWPVDLILVAKSKPVGLIEAKQEERLYSTMHRDNSAHYANNKLERIIDDSLPFVYESTGEVIRYTHYRNPKPRLRPLFTFHLPQAFALWLRDLKTLRTKIINIPVSFDYYPITLGDTWIEIIHECLVAAITNLETLIKGDRLNPLVQISPASGKIFIVTKIICCLLKFARTERILSLRNTRNLGEQAEQGLERFQPKNNNWLFPKQYGLTRLSTSLIRHDSQVYISNMQLLYSNRKELCLMNVKKKILLRKNGSLMNLWFNVQQKHSKRVL